MLIRNCSFNAIVKSVVLLPFVALSLSACNSNEDDAIDKALVGKSETSKMQVVQENDTKIEESKTMTLTGQITFQQFEGGFYGFIANNGDKYMPSGLKSEYRKNGLIVEMKVEPIEGIATTQQFGKLVKILEIRVIDASKVSDINQTY